MSNLSHRHYKSSLNIYIIIIQFFILKKKILSCQLRYVNIAHFFFMPASLVYMNTFSLAIFIPSFFALDIKHSCRCHYPKLYLHTQIPIYLSYRLINYLLCTQTCSEFYIGINFTIFILNPAIYFLCYRFNNVSCEEKTG